MDLKELSAYFTGLLKSEAEVVAAFFMGVLLTVMLGFSLRRWMASVTDAGVELARKDADIARKDTDLARKEVQIAGLETKLAILEGKLLDEEKLVTLLRSQAATSVTTPATSAQLDALRATCAQLGAENQQLREINQALEADAANLRTKLSHALAEGAHWAKWSKVFDEENARLAEIEALREG